ncbi:NAD(P)/FAD-dependent oxidoreductase [Ktedonospora formicarum]|uniref:FAD/NAD(P)-binding domain-containing protein n=1 Tax=Ktedonospora formicarum TaxID=2778364 RepID=A0A8J3MPU5_9CHLR|nr:FAD-dependent oxidoreductase [Ktedonospora formicarum]GHO44202.1 hypothetical protein KSX_23650 [Ktedonospora formicarum]
MQRADIVIIGNGIAGLTAAVEARRYATDKRIVIITEQVHPTINTPALKQFAIGRLSREQLLAYPAGTERQEHIRIMPAHVEEIHANSRYVTLTDGQTLGYGKLLIATGSVPIGLPETIPGRNFDGVLTLHRLQNYLDLRRRLPEVREAVVIGGGVHAIETVMGLLYLNMQVHWLIRGKTFMGRTLDNEASQIVLDNVRRAGAKVHTETEAIGVVGRVGAVIGVITNQQQMLPCQLVLMCTGTQPAMDLAKRSTIPIQHKQGIIVDDQLRTNVPHIFAAGDVAALPNPQTGKYAPRAQWYSAVLQGRLVGAMLAGRKDLAQQQFGIAWHATHVGELSMLTVGDPLLEGPTISKVTDKSQGGYRRLALEGDRLVGYLSLGQTQPDSLAIKRIIEEGHSVRNILRELQKGNFDARQYLSRLNSHTARGIISGKLPVIQAPTSTTTKNLKPQLDEQPAVAAKGTGPIQLQGSLHSEMQKHTGPIEMTHATRQPSNNDQQRDTGEAWLLDGASEAPQASQHSLNPFNGNLPVPGYSLLGDEEIEVFSGRLPQPMSSMVPHQEREPFSGNRPQPGIQNPNQRKNEPKKLWSYAEKTPGRRAETQKNMETSPSPGNTGQLWLYGKRQDSKKE